MSLLHYAVWPWDAKHVECVEPRGQSFELQRKLPGDDRLSRWTMRLHRLDWPLALDGCLFVYAITRGMAENAAAACVRGYS